MHYFRRVLPYLRPHSGLALVSILATILTSLVGLATPWPLKFLVDNVLGSEPLPALVTPAIGPLASEKGALLALVVVVGLGLAFGENALHVVSNYVNTKLEQQIILDFRRDMFRHAQRLSVAYHDQVSTGRLMYGINFEADAAGGLIMAIQPLAQSALTIVGMVWILIGIDPLLALLALTIVPILYYSIGYYAKRIQPQLMHVKGMEADSLSIIHEAMQLVRVITAFRREEYENRRFYRQGHRALDGRVKVTVRQTLFSLVVNVTTAVGTALVLGFGAWHALQGRLTAGELLVVMSYVAAVYKPLEAISYTIGSLQDRFVGLQMAFHILDTEPVVQETPEPLRLGRAHGRVTFENVSFSYPSRIDTLQNISFEVLPGQAAAIVGPTGAGKTSLMGLLARFYDPTHGRILIDGHDAQRLTLDSLRDQISLVPQEPLLFSGTIADNIRYGRLEATFDEIVQAAHAANAHEFVMRLPQQYDTPVGERGVQLSGGERQRICVARAFLKDAPILILDEPTSSIDSRTEAVILDALDDLMIGRTTFVIAHRLSTVRHADVILTIDQGRLVEIGTHEELVARNGLYRQLHDVQVGQARRKRRLMAAWSGTEAALPAETASGAESLVGPAAAVPPPAGESAWLSDAQPLSASLTSDPPTTWAPGQSRTYVVSLTNTGTEAWPAGGAEPVNLAVYFSRADDSAEPWSSEPPRYPLPADIAPGQGLTMTLTVTAPREGGEYSLHHRLVKENVAWFGHGHRATVTVRDTPPFDPAVAEPVAFAEHRS